MRVYVLHLSGEPIMPCSPRKARKLLKANKAKVIRLEPFTIQLTYDSCYYTQPITLGVDAGSKTIGLSASTPNKVLFEAEAELRTDIVELIATRREARHTRRNRKTRYRKARFNNRKNRKGKLAPSTQAKVDAHLERITFVHKILPIQTIILELANFDIQKIKNPDIEGKEYQQGEQMGFWNVREYVLFRDKHECQCCHGKSGDKRLNVHHIDGRKTGGNAPNDLITLCETCHDGHHKGTVKLPTTIKRGMIFRDATFMNVMKQYLYDTLITLYYDVRITYGYITKNTRINNKLPKSHYIDARCIAGHPLATPNTCVYKFRKIRRHNRKLYKDKALKGGIRKRNQCQYKMFGFRRYDTVIFESKRYYINSLRTSGCFQIKSLIDNTVTKELSYKKLKLYNIRNGWLSSIQNII